MKSGQAEIMETSKGIQKSGLMSRRIAILEFILRIVAFFNTIGSAILMGTTHETLPFFTQFIRFQAEYNDLPALTFFVVANAVVSGYLILSLTLAFVHIVKRKTQNTRILLIILDVVSHQQIKTCSVYSLILLLTIDSSSCVRQCWVF
jgi:uncharacterized protein (TIGR01569 family)